MSKKKPARKKKKYSTIKLDLNPAELGRLRFISKLSHLTLGQVIMSLVAQWFYDEEYTKGKFNEHGEYTGDLLKKIEGKKK